MKISLFLIVLFEMSQIFHSIKSSPSIKYQSNCSPTNDESKPFLWEIKGNPPSYLFGTIHVPYVEVWDAVPKNVLKLFNKTTHLYIEIDLNKPNVQKDFASCVLLPKGK